MKNFSTMLSNANMTPKERYLLFVRNDVTKLTTGKEPLSEAEKEALQNWRSKNNQESDEWNRYNDGYYECGKMMIDIEILFWQTSAEHYRNSLMGSELLLYPFYREHMGAVKALDRIKVVNIKEALEITNKQRAEQLKGGLDFEYAVHQLAFESLDDELRKDILILDQEAEYEPSYLDDEETIASLLNGKRELTIKAKEKYAELVADRSYNEFAKEYQIWGSFASLPIMEIAKKWTKDKNIKPIPKDYEWLEKMRGKFKNADAEERLEQKLKEKSDDEWLLEENMKEILEDYARDNETTVKNILKETLLKWLEEGLPYTPLVISDDKKTYGEDTKLPHDQIFKEWLKAKSKAKETLKKIADKGDLKITGETITGESLYNFNTEYKFVKDFKERVDNYCAGLGIVYADDDPEHKGKNIDTELLIANKNDKGELNALSLFGMAVKKLKSLSRFSYFKETEQDDETFLEFKNDNVERAFKDTRQSLIDGYAKLLAFKEILKRLFKLYEIEMDYLNGKRLESVGEFIDRYNNSLDNALEDLYGFGVGFGSYKKPLKTRENLFIEKNNILPDAKTLEEWSVKFKDIFGNEF